MSILSGLFFAVNMQAQNASDTIENSVTGDSIGWGMAIAAIVIVFAVFIGLFLLFHLIGSTAVSLSHKRLMKVPGISKEEAKGMSKQSGEIYAAIAMAIYEATEMHDDENTILTIQNTVRNYSPWNSKIYTLREMPTK